MQRIDLTNNWQFKQLSPASDPLQSAKTGDDWHSASVPGTVHTDLMQAGLIPDPFWRTNEQDAQWVGEVDWLYRCAFDVPEAALANEHVALCFDGLDTFATVWLNNEQILVSDNMFIPSRLDVKHLLESGDNTLLIRFESAVRRGRERETPNPTNQQRVWNGDSSRVFVRKAQYHYGWDWGPTLMTAGIWRSVRLEADNNRIVEVNPVVEVSDDLKQAVINVQVALSSRSADSLVHIELFAPDGSLAHSADLTADQQLLEYRLTLDNPQLWYPNGYGTQALYQLNVALSDSGSTDVLRRRLGLRRLRVVQEGVTNEPGTSFYFEVNNVPVFCGGANWIPADSFTPRLSYEAYRR